MDSRRGPRTLDDLNGGEKMPMTVRESPNRLKQRLAALVLVLEVVRNQEGGHGELDRV